MSNLHATALLLAALAAACTAGPAAAPVRLVPGDQRPVRIESTTFAPDGRSVEVRVSSPRGIFALDLDLSGEHAARIERVVLVVAEERFCEGFEAEVVDASGVETTVGLLGRADVAIAPRGADLEVVLGPGTVAALRPRARLQFVDQWR
ncbi:hypothetical protein KGQ64_08865 [bacterium]|nr:hypothetical protein [bacterium]